MTEEFMVNTEKLSLGQSLKTLREERGYSKDDVAQSLKFSLRQVEALEADNFSALPSKIFVRGFVRNYAKFLGTDAQPLIHLLDEALPGRSSSTTHKLNSNTKTSATKEDVRVEDPDTRTAKPKSKNGIKWLAMALVLIVLAGGLYWSQSKAPVSAEETSQRKEATVTVPTIVEQAIASANKEASKNIAEVQKKPIVNDSNSLANASDTLAADAAGYVQLKLTVKNDAWISVVDAKKQKIVYEVLKSGTTIERSGLPPLKFNIGNAKDVELSVDGKVFDFSNNVKGTGARFTWE